MSYSFQAYIDALGSDWYSDDDFLRNLIRKYCQKSEAAQRELAAWGPLCGGVLYQLSELSARPENAPWIRHFDAHNNRLDEVVLPQSTHQALAIAAGEHKLGAIHGDWHLFYAKNYMLAQNGEAGIGCSMACTDGLVRALEALGGRPEHSEAVSAIRNCSPEKVVHGAQFVTEIQGGSDVPANEVVATADGNEFRLQGQKWFCSNINADYYLVTARPEGAEKGGRGVALFLVPAYLQESQIARNGHRLDRLKDKLGTRELATAEVTFEGALAYPVGELDRGVANVLNYVLVTSRFACANSAAAGLKQAERIVTAYTDFRTAFGRKIVDFPLVREMVGQIRTAREETLASVFELVRLWQRAYQDPKGEEALDFRIMMSLCKPILTRRCSVMIHEAMMLLAGNGIEERFSFLPRLFRDSVIMETWEGPHNLLFDQAYRDMRRFHNDPAAFVERVTGDKSANLVEELRTILAAGDDLEATIPFAAWSKKLVSAFGRRLRAEASCGSLAV